MNMAGCLNSKTSNYFYIKFVLAQQAIACVIFVTHKNKHYLIKGLVYFCHFLDSPYIIVTITS